MNRKLTFPEASKYLREELGIPISESTLRKRAAEGQIPHYRFGRTYFDPTELADYVQAHHVDPETRGQS